MHGLEYTVPFSSMTACENLLMEKWVFRATSARTTLTFPTKGKYWTAICIIWAPIKQQNNDVDILPYQKVNRNIVHAIFLVFLWLLSKPEAILPCHESYVTFSLSISSSLCSVNENPQKFLCKSTKLFCSHHKLSCFCTLHIKMLAQDG